MYSVLKALHAVAAVIFVGGTLSGALTLRMLAANDPGEVLRQRVISVARTWDRVATTPAMAVVWAAGITLALEGAWFGDLWLTVKLVAVVALSAIHGVQAGRLRRLARAKADNTPRETSLFLVLGLVAIAIVFVVLKPGHR